MDGRGDGAADGVTGGRAWRASTLSLQRTKLISVLFRVSDLTIFGHQKYRIRMPNNCFQQMK